MTRLQISAFLLLAWGFVLVPTQSFAAPPAHDTLSRAGVGQGGAAERTFPSPLERKIAPRNATDNPAAAKPSTATSRSSGSAVQTALGLAFVLCLILIVAAWAKRYLPQANKALPSEAVQILGQRPIGQRQMVQLIRCGSRILILGSTPQGLTTLSEVTDPVEVDYLAGLCRQDQPHSVTSAFSRLFQNYREMSENKETSDTSRRFSVNRAQSPRSEADDGHVQPQLPRRESAADSPERSLKERLGRLGQTGDASRFSPPGAEGSYE